MVPTRFSRTPNVLFHKLQRNTGVAGDHDTTANLQQVAKSRKGPTAGMRAMNYPNPFFCEQLRLLSSVRGVGGDWKRRGEGAAGGAGRRDQREPLVYIIGGQRSQREGNNYIRRYHTGLHTRPHSHTHARARADT